VRKTGKEIASCLSEPWRIQTRKRQFERSFNHAGFDPSSGQLLLDDLSGSGMVPADHPDKINAIWLSGK
jgi:hypothetical protein